MQQAKQRTGQQGHPFLIHRILAHYTHSQSTKNLGRFICHIDVRSLESLGQQGLAKEAESKLQMTSSHGRYSCQFGPDPRLTHTAFCTQLEGCHTSTRSEVWMTLPMTPRTSTNFNGFINRENGYRVHMYSYSSHIIL